MTSPPGTPRTGRAWAWPPSRSRSKASRSSKRSTRTSRPPRICTSTKYWLAAAPEMDTRVQAGRLDRAYYRSYIETLSVAVLDLDAFEANAADLARRAQGTTIRVASKSLRVRRLIGHVLTRPGFRGVLAYTLPEALWLVEHGATDVVVAYPTADRSALSRLATDEQAREAITVMVDETAQLDLILDAARARSGAPVLSPRRRIRVAIELDAAYSPLPGVRMGALRSPLRRPHQVLDLAREVQDRSEEHTSELQSRGHLVCRR